MGRSEAVSNAISGYAFEQEFCKLLQQHGFWALRVTPNAAGQQPADIIAVKKGYHALIDCKLISNNNGFRFSRVEDNQRMSMTAFKAKAGEQGWFAIKPPDKKIRMIGLDTILELEKKGKASIPVSELDEHCIKFKEWLEWVTSWKSL